MFSGTTLRGSPGTTASLTVAVAAPEGTLRAGALQLTLDVPISACGYLERTGGDGLSCECVRRASRVSRYSCGCNQGYKRHRCAFISM